MLTVRWGLRKGLDAAGLQPLGLDAQLSDRCLKDPWLICSSHISTGLNVPEPIS